MATHIPQQHLRALRNFAKALAFLLVSTGGACRSEDAVTVPNPRTTVVLHVPGARVHAIAASPDGALFVGLAGGIFRMIPSRSMGWEKVAETTFVPTRFHAPSRSTLFILGQMSGNVYQWEAGLGVRTMVTPLSDSVVGDGHGQANIGLRDVWGRGANDVYAVGYNAAVIHFDGHSWTLEQNPLVKYAFEPGLATLRSVGGDGQTVYSAGTFDLIAKGTQGWRIIEPPMRENSPAWHIAGRVGNGMLFVGRERTEQVIRAFNYEGGAWTDLSSKLRAIRGDIGHGTSQEDGSLIFWTHLAELVRVQPDHGVTIYPHLSLSLVRGGAIVENRLYVAGTRRDNAVVLRVD